MQIQYLQLILQTKKIMTKKIEFTFRYLAAGDHEPEHKDVFEREIKNIMLDIVTVRAGITMEDVRCWEADAGTMKLHSEHDGWFYDVSVVVHLKENMDVNDIGYVSWRWGGC